MWTNPFADTWQLLFANQPDQLARGEWRWVLLGLISALLASSIAVTILNWRDALEQRTFPHMATWLARALVGGMWLQGTLWKLPLFTTDNGLFYLTQQMIQHSAFAWHRYLVSDILIPAFLVIGPVVYLVELAFAASLMLGLAVRLTGLVGVFFVLNLWIGLYRHPGEWPWKYVFLALLMVAFSLHAAGRSLGLDALLRRLLLHWAHRTPGEWLLAAIS